MIDPIEFEHEGIKVVVRVVWAGWEYDFEFDGSKYFAHYQHSFSAVDGAKEKIRQLVRDRAWEQANKAFTRQGRA